MQRRLLRIGVTGLCFFQIIPGVSRWFDLLILPWENIIKSDSINTKQTDIKDAQYQLRLI